MAAIDWTPVEEAEAENTVAGLKVALLESAKIFEQRMRDEKIPGRTVDERFEAVRFHLTRPTDAERAYRYVEKLRSDTTGALTEERGKSHLQAFRQAVADMNDLSQARDSFAAQLKLYFGLLKGKQGWLVRILIGVGIFFLTVLFLADSAPGQVLVAGVVGFVHLFFSWIVGLLIGIALLVFVVLATALYLDRKGGRVRGEDE